MKTAKEMRRKMAEHTVLVHLEATARSFFYTNREAAVVLQWEIFSLMKRWGWIPKEGHNGDFIEGDFNTYASKQTDKILELAKQYGWTPPK